MLRNGIRNKENIMRKNKNVIKINEAQLREMVAESIKKVLSENEFGNLKWNNGYDSYVLVDDSCDAVIQNYTSKGEGYDAEKDAINDAKKKAQETRGGSFSVFGCVNNYYDENTLVYCTSSDRNSWKF